MANENILWKKLNFMNEDIIENGSTIQYKQSRNQTIQKI